MKLDRYIDNQDPKSITRQLKTFKLLSENNILAFGALIPVLALVPGFIDELIGLTGVIAIGLAALALRQNLVASRNQIIHKLDDAREKGIIHEEEYKEAIRDLNSITVAK